MEQGAEDCLQTVDDMVGYDDTKGGSMTDLVLSNYPKLAEQSTDHVNVHHLDVDSLKDGPYHPNVAGYDFYHQVLAKN